jgi:hypothetical protein
MGNESRKPPGEDDPTDELEALDRDGTSANQLDDTHRLRVIATGGPAPAGETDKTFDRLKALDHGALAAKDSAAEPPPTASRKVAYNPYATAPPDKPKPKI